jgi:1-acyl-sn-glycerol-3-phosphate acyltransferase
MMRPAYLTLKFVLKYTLWVYYPRTRIVNKPKKRLDRTIFASNHAASFMDPLVIASNQPPIVFFMTRSDVFTLWLKPILWAAHMLPIYRTQDGVDTKAKNEAVFQTCYKILNFGRSLIIFSEGFTDDVFIRSLKPIKKGAVRIGFGACEHLNWKKNIYVQAVGINYSDPNHLGSDVVIANGKKICLNDYKEEYLANPNKVVAELTKVVEKDQQDQLTYIENKKWAPTHERIMRLTKKGMSPVDSDKSIPLLKRWEYSRALANWFNSIDLDQHEGMLNLRQELESYFEYLKKQKIEEFHLTQIEKNKWSKNKDYVFFILLAPITLIGLIHNYLPYRLIKSFVEKSFRRKVFWGSVKMTLGALAIGIYNIIFLLILNYTLYQNGAFWWLYFFIVPPLTGVVAYNYFKRIKLHKEMKRLESLDLSEAYKKRRQAMDMIAKMIEG